MGSATPWQVLSGLLFLASVGVVVYLVFVIMERDDLAEKVAKLEQENLEYQNNYLAATPRPVRDATSPINHGSIDNSSATFNNIGGTQKQTGTNNANNNGANTEHDVITPPLPTVPLIPAVTTVDVSGLVNTPVVGGGDTGAVSGSTGETNRNTSHLPSGDQSPGYSPFVRGPDNSTTGNGGQPNPDPAPPGPSSQSYCREEPEVPLRRQNVQQDKNDLFDELSSKEYSDVYDFLLKQTELGLTKTFDAKVSSNYVFMVDLWLPNKTDVIEFLERDGPKPRRHARATAFMGAENPPYVAEYLVNIPPTEYRPLYNPASKTPIPFHSRPIHFPEYRELFRVLRETIKDVDYIIRESYANFTFGDCGEKCLTFYSTAANSKSGQRRSWMHGFRMSTVTSYYIHPISFAVLIDHTGNLAKNFHIIKIQYNGQLFDNTTELRTKYDNNEIEKDSLPPPPAFTEATYDSFISRGFLEPQVPLRPPRQFEPDGRRFTVDKHHIQYLGWTFYFRMRTLNGLQLLDITYRGQRIAYELGLQEIAVLYAGNAASAMGLNVFDTSFLAGAQHYQLVRGVDCPESALFFDTIHFIGYHTTNKNTVCIFEWNSGFPLRRHYSGGGDKYQYYFGQVDSYLVARSIGTVGNYDYVFDYIFHQNGAMEIKVASTGFVQTFTFNKNESPYAYSINKPLKVAANIHNHLFHFKIDLDILGRQNRYETLDIKAEAVPNTLDPTITQYQKHFEHNLKRTEQEAIGKYDFDNPKYHVIYNDKLVNAQGYSRGYRIHSMGLAKMLIPKGKGVDAAASWARNQIVVTKHNDHERTTGSLFSVYDPYDPVINFQKFFDNNDSIVDEDLVTWVTLGIQHIPSAEDVPVTTTTGKILEIGIIPFNYFDDDISMASRDSVIISPDQDGVDYVETYGRNHTLECLPRQAPWSIGRKD